MFKLPIIAVALLLALVCIARGDDRWAKVPPEVREWYRQAELTEAAQKRFPHKKCCDESEVYRTQFKVNSANGTDEWWYMRDGEWRLIPPDIVHIDKHAPDNQPTLFIYKGKETCFFPGGTGG